MQVRAAALAGLLLTLTACSPALQERFNEAWHHDQQVWTSRDWGQGIKDLFEIDKLTPTYAMKERAADNEVCFHPTSQRRVMQQNGVADRIDYTWCAFTPYGDQGQRLKGRPQS